MYPELQSAFLAETSAPLILLGGAVLLYRSFRDRYLLPWIAGWGVYALSRLFLAVSRLQGPEIWLVLANLAFVVAMTLFAAAVFYYVDRPNLIWRISLAVFPAAVLGIFQALWPEHANVLLFFFRICCWSIAGTAAWQLLVFMRGRGNVGAWILSGSLLLLFPHRHVLVYAILADVLLGISMMMIVLDDSRVQNQRLDILNRLSQIVSGSSDFLSIVDAILAELTNALHPKAAWFRVLEEGKLRVAAQRGLPEPAADTIFEIDAAESSSGQLLDQGEVGVVRERNMMESIRPTLSRLGIEHIVVVPVMGKSTRVGILVLGMQRARSYTENDRSFLRAAGNQLGLAAENRRLVHQLVRSVHDLTETKATEARYKTLFDHMHEGVFVSSPDGHILDCNDAFVSMMGYSSKEELSKVDVSEVLYLAPEDRRHFLALMEKYGFVRNFEFALRRKDGTRINLIESSFATSNPDGTGVRYQGVVLDITEKKRAENEIRRRNRELSALHTIAVSFNQSFDLDQTLRNVLAQIVAVFGSDAASLYLFDKANRVLRMRANFGHRVPWPNRHRLMKIPADALDAIRAQHAELIPGTAILTSPIFAPIVAAEDLKSAMGIILWRQDEILGALGTGSRTHQDFGREDEHIMVALGRQLATTIDRIMLYEETRKAYEDLRRTQEQLLQSEKMSAVGRMISGVAHELNNPLTAISGYIQLLESEQVEPQVREFVRKLHKQAERAQRIVQNLLSFSRQHKPQRIYVDLRKVMEDTIALRDYEIKTHGVVLEKEFDTVLPAVVADPHQLEQVFLNIINNAVDAILESARIGVLKIRIFAEDGEAVCEFHDSGPGMLDPKHVFDPFYTTKSVGKGTGLGLSICYGIVKEHGGEITAVNHPQGGAVVRVLLPEAVGEKPLTEGERILARRESSVKGRVLLVDVEKVLNFEREVLAAAGFEVVAFSNSEQAMEWLEHESCDLVLLDSEVNAERILAWMQESHPEIAGKAVLMVPPANGSTPRSFLNASGFLCFVKPFEAAPLLAVLRRILRASVAAGYRGQVTGDSRT